MKWTDNGCKKIKKPSGAPTFQHSHTRFYLSGSVLCLLYWVVFVLCRKRSGGSAPTGGRTNEKSTKWTEDCKQQSGERDEDETLHLRGQRQALGCVLRLPFKGLRREGMDHLVNASWLRHAELKC